MRGFRWTGASHDWKVAPHEYGAIHFHEDDVYDMGWEEAFSYTVPDGLRSGAYAARLRLGDETEFITFFVSATSNPQRKRPRVALLLPTATYLAYANERVYILGPKLLYNMDFPPMPEAIFHEEHGAFGLSHYENHVDGSGVHFSSWLRPLWNVGPNSRSWGFSTDTNLIHWLETRGFDYDVVTDHDLHQRGAEALKGYRTVITGTHPEYVTGKMYGVVEEFLGRGGRLMYMGGNGFYWKCTMGDQWPGALELRRSEGGTRSWASDPGEYYHALDGELGGLWRRQGRAPNRLVGTGFVAQGFIRSKPYMRTEASLDPRVAFVFEKVENESFGDYGRRGGGAAGEEIDAFDPALGSPSHAIVLARAEDFGSDMIVTPEELLVNVPVKNQRPARADLLFFETPAGGAVFSTSSIAWSSSLEHAGYENDISRISENVLLRFIDPEPFEMPAQEGSPVQSEPTERRDRSRLAG